MKDAASAVLAQEKATFLAELFYVKLKFTVDTLNDWFSRIIKSKFFEIDDIKKRHKNENSINKTKTICFICSFLLDIDNVGCFDFIKNVSTCFSEISILLTNVKK